MGGAHAAERNDAARVIALPRREPSLGEPPERPPAVVIAFPARGADERPPDRPPRLVI
jgi:hypothetical protein